MMELIILILDVMEMDPDNNVGPLARELVVMMRKIPVWERKDEWKKLRLALKHRFTGRITTSDLLKRMKEHAYDLEDKLKG